MKKRLRVLAILSGLFCSLLQGCAAPPVPPVSHCWIQIFTEAEFKPGGDHDIIFGPGAWPDLRHLPRAQRENWSGAVRSLITGPAARATLWPENDFIGPAITVEPDRPVPDLRALGIRRFGSLALSCPE